ncbi:MAG: aquaporin family protein [Chlamydiae bacterium]|nr:aquaporin family protein [Chlamydiota bacterium]
MGIFIGEFIGTLLLILLGNGVVANVLLKHSKGYGGGWIVIGLGWGFAVAIPIFIVGWISGAHLNPAVTLGLCCIGKSSWSHLPLYFTSQMLGAMTGSFLVWISYHPHFKATQDPSLTLSCFCTQPAIRHYVFNFCSELISTAVLMLGILGILDSHNHLGAGIGPIAIGLLVASLLLSLGGPTGVAINPARDLGPRIMHALLPIAGKKNSDFIYGWIPVIAPFIGAAVGAVAYQWLLSNLTPLQAFIE